MGSRVDGKRKARSGPGGVLRLVTMGLAAAAVIKELRTERGKRTWHGTVAGVVPYDFRMPTLERFRARMWNPEDEHWLSPRVFGVGWTTNVGRIVTVLRQEYAKAR